MHIEAGSVSPIEAYRLLTACVVPRPIAWVTSVSDEGIVNAAPFSFFTAVSAEPPIVMISVERRMGEPKDTARNIRASREFVVNIVTEELAHAMNRTAANYPKNTSEVVATGLALIPGVKIKTPRIDASPINLECSVVQWIELGKGPSDLIFGEILAFHIREEVLSGGRIDFRKLKAIGRLSGSAYCKTTEVMEMRRDGAG